MNEHQQTRHVSSNKRQLGLWIVAAWMSFLVILCLTWLLIPRDMTLGIQSLSARFIFTSAHIFCASLLLFLGFLAVGATRWQLETENVENNPAVSGGKTATSSAHNRVHTQFMSNSTEQFVMFSAALIAVTPFLTQPYLRLITLVTILWIFGRLFFWGGYWYTVMHHLPTYPRAIGLGMGLLCTFMMASLAIIGICLHFPAFSSIISYADPAAPLTAFAFKQILIQPTGVAQGSNLIPIIFVSIIVIVMGALAVKPKFAPPVIPMALVSIVGWVWLLFSGTIPVR